MRFSFLLLALSACSSSTPVPCADQSVCAPLGALCVSGVCRKPEDVDLAVSGDLASPPDLATSCSDSTGCTIATSPVCDGASHTCRACATGDCAGVSPLCAPSGACVACLGEAQCAAQALVCSPAGLCVAC